HKLFYTEAKALRSLLKHDRIPELLAFFEDEARENFFMVQEFIPGQTLKQILKGGRRLSEPQALYLLKSVLEVLETVHAQNTIHLDIKPGNLIHRRTDRAVVLIDFGAVKQVSTQIVNDYGATVQTAAIGTPGYMPCEQSYGRPKFSSDLYALGMVVIQAVTGCHPTKLPEDPQTGEFIWRELAPVSPELVDILGTMVRYHFGQRQQSARAVLAQIDALLEDRRQQAAQQQPRSPRSRPSTRGAIAANGTPVNRTATNGATTNGVTTNGATANGTASPSHSAPPKSAATLSPQPRPAARTALDPTVVATPAIAELTSTEAEPSPPSAPEARMEDPDETVLASAPAAPTDRTAIAPSPPTEEFATAIAAPAQPQPASATPQSAPSSRPVPPPHAATAETDETVLVAVGTDDATLLAPALTSDAASAEDEAIAEDWDRTQVAPEDKTVLVPMPPSHQSGQSTPQPPVLWQTQLAQARIAIFALATSTRQRLQALHLGDRIHAQWTSGREQLAASWASPRTRQTAIASAKVGALVLVAGGILYGSTRTVRWLGDRAKFAEATALVETDLEGAIAKAQSIAAGSPVFVRASNSAQTWQQYLQHRQTLTRAKQQADTDPATAVALLADIPADSPSRSEAERLQLQWQQRSIDRARLDEAIALATSGTLDDLSQALDELEALPTESELYDEGRRQIENVLADILTASSPTLESLDPQVELGQGQVTVSYASTAPLLLEDEGIRRVSVAVMGVLRTQFLDFDRLVVYSRNGDRQTTLPLSLWLSYKSEDGLTLPQLLTELEVGDR
ncbi:MAG: AarF/UbiB family protein, partial [Cyanobacteria bacterium J06639_1]